jgi:amino acid adenylation domain-containing protein
MHTALASLVEALETSPAAAVCALDVLPASERHRVLYEWNDTRVVFPADKCVHQLFEQQVEKTPDAVAVVFEESELSYAELNARANRLAHYLRELGVRPDDRVAMCVERSFDMIVALLAVLKAGGAYVPLDPAYPAERLRFMLEDSAPAALLTQSHLEYLFSGLSDILPIYNLDVPEPLWKERPDTNPDPRSIGLTSNHLAYIIYTSGSTGTPKGVMVQHKGLCNRLDWMQSAYELNSHDAVLQKTPFSFDVSVWEFFWPLLTGTRLVIARPQGHTDPAYLIDVIRQNNITTTHFVPSMLQIFLEHPQAAECSTLLRVVCSGEALPALLAQRFQEQLPHAVIHNLYGPTEATVDVTAWTCTQTTQPIATIPIGRPIANMRIYILDGHGEPAPVGVAGELYIGGVGVARGYLNRPELTAERFLEDPFASQPGARMYRTGDLGRWLPDGNIEFLGRNDFQVKLRGFRIELGEIEARLLEYSGVREAVVVAREDTPGGKRLVAYYIATGDIAPEQIRSHLAASLPEYMVPSAYVRLESLPLTPNGKLDRKALPAPEGDAFASRGYQPPQGETEIKLAAIWAEVLKLERVGRHDHFFELGGHSLLAVRIVSRMRQVFDVEVEVARLFEHPVLSDLAELTIDAQLSQVPSDTLASLLRLVGE